ncbi:MAG: hypothetical protein DYH13_04340 [Alphaproteobacteria bacterium PRO2]|nr:hypothetical protein [Alphaproteobacteria bacterium PRO2]
MNDENADARRVKGRVHSYSRAVNAGVIIIGTKKMYLFWRKDWLSPEDPKINMNVVFIPERKWAKSIMVEQG